MRLATVTGGARGLGLALCLRFEARGYRVIEFSRSAPHEYPAFADFPSPEQSRQAALHAIEGADSDPIKNLVFINNTGVLEPIGPTSRKPRLAVIAIRMLGYTAMAIEAPAKTKSSATVHFYPL